MNSGREKFRKNKKMIILLSLLLRLFSRRMQERMFIRYNRGENKIILALRYCLLRNLCKTCGDNVYVGEYVTIKHFENLCIGTNVSIHKYSYIDAIGEIVIGDNVSIATGCKFFSFNHGYSDLTKPIKYNDITLGKIVIKDDVWIGADTIILSSVTVNKRVVIGAKSVVTKNVESESVYAGSPAKFIKKIG